MTHTKDPSPSIPHRFRSLVFLLPLLLLTASPAASADWQLRLSTNNDLLVNNAVDDDFYTFGGGIELTFESVTIRWQENAFTDSFDDFRFDETYLTVGALAPRSWLGDWSLWVEAGAVHLGEGVLGQDLQNDVHELIGDDPVRLPYLDLDEVYGHAQIQLDRQWHVAGTWSWGPQLTASYTHDYRRDAMAGLRTRWQPSEHFGIDAVVGYRFAETDLAHLAPHLDQEAPAVRVDFALPWGFGLSWTTNRYGTQRDHVTLVYRIGPGASPRREGAWIEAGADR